MPPFIKSSLWLSPFHEMHARQVPWLLRQLKLESALFPEAQELAWWVERLARD